MHFSSNNLTWNNTFVTIIIVLEMKSKRDNRHIAAFNSLLCHLEQTLISYFLLIMTTYMNITHIITNIDSIKKKMNAIL